MVVILVKQLVLVEGAMLTLGEEFGVSKGAMLTLSEALTLSEGAILALGVLCHTHSSRIGWPI